MAPVFLPFIILYLNGSYKDLVIGAKPESTMQECLDKTQKQLTSFLDKLPEGVTIKGGCLPIPAPIDLSKPGDTL